MLFTNNDNPHAGNLALQVRFFFFFLFSFFLLYMIIYSYHPGEGSPEYMVAMDEVLTTTMELIIT